VHNKHYYKSSLKDKIWLKAGHKLNIKINVGEVNLIELIRYRIQLWSVLIILMIIGDLSYDELLLNSRIVQLWLKKQYVCSNVTINF
jgi:hypothetical protein